MILERKYAINSHNLQEKYGQSLKQSKNAGSLDELIQLAELQHIYRAAMNEISTKLEILDSEFQIRHQHNPIHHLECRLKSPSSMMEKLKKYGFPANLTLAKEKLHDIAGIRIICNYIEDIYIIEKLLLNQSDIQLLQRKDYIQNPKVNGYRSLHIIVSVPVFLSDKKELLPVEIQIRTIAMDYWASLEHELRYKNNPDNLVQFTSQLYDCSKKLADIELTMQRIHTAILMDVSAM